MKHGRSPAVEERTDRPRSAPSVPRAMVAVDELAEGNPMAGPSSPPPASSLTSMEPIRPEDFQPPRGRANLAELLAYRERMLRHLAAALADLERLHTQHHQQLGDPDWEGARARAESRLAVALELTNGVDQLMESASREQERTERNAAADDQASINRGLRQATWVMAGFTLVLAALQLLTLGAQLWIALHHVHP